MFIDAGNSFIKMATFEGEWYVRLRLPIADFLELPFSALNALMLEQSINVIHDSILENHWVASVVAGDTVKQKIFLWAQSQKVTLKFVQAEAKHAGFVNHYQPPESLGTDRYLALLGARSWQDQTQTTPPPAVVIVSLGTALTMDYLSSDGHFRGGMIAPGLTLQRQALARGTAQLPLPSEDQADEDKFPLTTQSAILHGTTTMLMGAVMLAWQQWRDLADSTVLILTGGGAESMSQSWRQACSTIAPHCLQVSPFLVFEGMRYWMLTKDNT